LGDERGEVPLCISYGVLWNTFGVCGFSFGVLGDERGEVPLWISFGVLWSIFGVCGLVLEFWETSEVRCPFGLHSIHERSEVTYKA